jgi:hypothetical protein
MEIRDKSHTTDELVQFASILASRFTHTHVDYQYFFNRLTSQSSQIIVMIRNGFIIEGGMILVPGKYSHSHCSLNSLGMSFMAKRLGSSVTNIGAIFAEYLNLKLEKEYDVLIGFQRKQLRGYWRSYGFAEFENGNYDNWRLLLSELPPIDYSGNWYSYQEDDFEKLIALRNLDVSDVLFRVRDKQSWRLILKNFLEENGKIYVFKKEDSITGYVFLQDNQVLECRFSSKFEEACIRGLWQFQVDTLTWPSFNNIDTITRNILLRLMEQVTKSSNSKFDSMVKVSSQILKTFVITNKLSLPLLKPEVESEILTHFFIHSDLDRVHTSVETLQKMRQISFRFNSSALHEIRNSDLDKA